MISRDQRILVTGGAGFIGTHLAERLSTEAEVTLFDNFRRDWARDGNTLLGPLCVKNKLSCKEHTGLTGYPKSLDTLLKVELSGAESVIGESIAIRRYLRKIPIDPMTKSQEWGIRCYQDDADVDDWCEEDVFDIFTTHTGTAIDGTSYRDW